MLLYSLSTRKQLSCALLKIKIKTKHMKAKSKIVFSAKFTKIFLFLCQWCVFHSLLTLKDLQRIFVSQGNYVIPLPPPSYPHMDSLVPTHAIQIFRTTLFMTSHDVLISCHDVVRHHVTLRCHTNVYRPVFCFCHSNKKNPWNNIFDLVTLTFDLSPWLSDSSMTSSRSLPVLNFMTIHQIVQPWKH